MVLGRAAVRTKTNKRLHGVPLPSLCATRPAPASADQWLTYSPVSDEGHIYVRGLWIADQDHAWLGWHGGFHSSTGRGTWPKPNWPNSQVAPHIRDRLFDHVAARGSGGEYDHHHYKDEMLAALETVGGVTSSGW